MFHGNEQYQKLKLTDPSYTELLEEVVDKAQGVFLWVFLVVRDLLEGLTYNDSIKTMRTCLECFPEDLEGFFRHMLEAVPKIYQGQTACAFQVALSNDYPLLLMTYACLDDVEEDHDLSFRKLKLFSNADIALKRDLMQRRLDGRTRGLLEIHLSQDQVMFYQNKVDFLHRTVRDFLQYSPEIQAVVSQSPEDELKMLLCHATVLVMKRAPSTFLPQLKKTKFTQCPSLLEELCLFSSKALEDPGTLQAVNELLVESIKPISRTSGVDLPGALEELLLQARLHGLVQEKVDSNPYKLHLQLQHRLAQRTSSRQAKHGMSTTITEAPAEKRRRIQSRDDSLSPGLTSLGTT